MARTFLSAKRAVLIKRPPKASAPSLPSKLCSVVSAPYASLPYPCQQRLARAAEREFQ